MNRTFYFIYFLLMINYSSAQKINTKTTEIEIPVVFHFVTKDEPNVKYSVSEMEDVLTEVNRRINTIDSDNLKTPFNTIARETNLKFVFRKFDKNCDTVESVTYHKTPLNGYTPWVDDAYLRSKGYYKPKEFLNIWICNLYGKKITGHTPKKEILNGIIIDDLEFDEIIIKKNQKWTLIHEIGHWLGLKHIWGGIDTDIDLDDCITDDGIDDTPKQKDPHFFNWTVIQNSCDGKQKTNHQNFMDYSYDTGMFTEDQVEVMRNNLKTKRAGLLWKPNCNNKEDEIESKIDDYKLLYYLFKLNDKDVPNNIASQYANKNNPKKFFQIKNNEFELKREIESVKKTITESSKKIGFNLLFKHSGDTYLRSKYSFDRQSFEIKGFSNLITNLNDNVFKNSFKRFNFRNNYNEGFSTNATKIIFINENAFTQINLPQGDAEVFKHSLVNNRIYYNLYFKILPIRVLDRNNKINGLIATIQRVEFYSDISKNNLIHVIEDKNSYNEYKRYKLAKKKRYNPYKKYDYSFE